MHLIYRLVLEFYLDDLSKDVFGQIKCFAVLSDEIFPCFYINETKRLIEPIFEKIKSGDAITLLNISDEQKDMLRCVIDKSIQYVSRDSSNNDVFQDGKKRKRMDLSTDNVFQDVSKRRRINSLVEKALFNLSSIYFSCCINNSFCTYAEKNPRSGLAMTYDIFSKK